MNKRVLSDGLSRRGFLGGAFALGALGPRAFAAPHGAFSKGEPNLRFALMSDVHICMRIMKEGRWRNDAAKFIHALKWFRDMKVDAVVCAGDLAEYGMVEELQKMAEVWESVFPEGKAPDGRSVEKVFVTGNHDWEGAIYGGGFAKKVYPDAKERAAKVFKNDRARHWERLFKEPYSPIYSKSVRGYTFIGQHWDASAWKGCGSFGLVKDFVEKNAASLAGAKPFFYVQHPVLRGTCNGPRAWGQDAGAATAALSKFPNAVAFSGHSHYSLTDETSIWQGAFTAVNASSLWYTGKPNLFQPDSPRPKLHGTTHAALVEVYDDRIVIVRRQFLPDETLAEDWVVPLPVAKAKPYALENRLGKSPAPGFGAVRLTVDNRKAGILRVLFPQALDNPKARPYKYIVKLDVEGGKGTSREIVEPRFNKAPSQMRIEGLIAVSFKGKHLPPGVKYRAHVVPVDSVGNEGAAISSDWVECKKKAKSGNAKKKKAKG